MKSNKKAVIAKLKARRKKLKDSKVKTKKPKKESSDGGEGSRGGVVTGYTASGKPKYESDFPGVSRRKPSKIKPEKTDKKESRVKKALTKAKEHAKTRLMKNLINKVTKE